MNNQNKLFKKLIISTSWLWFLLFSFIPMFLIFGVSLLRKNSDELFAWQLTLDNYKTLFNVVYFYVFIKSFLLATACTFICLIVAYPFAYLLTQISKKWRPFFLLLVIIPFWTNSLVRTYAIMSVLKTKGLINNLLLFLGIIKQPIQLLYSNLAVLIGCIYDLLPFMILPLFVSLNNLDSNLLEAAQDLGASKFNILKKIILPLSIPGIVSGSILVFLPSMTMFYIPVLLGGARNLLLGNLIEHQFLTSNNWPLGSAISVVLVLLMFLTLIVYWIGGKKEKNEKN